MSDCTSVREALSARLDGEEAALPVATVDAHVDGCAGCAAFAADVPALRGRLLASVEVPDLTDRILAAAPPPRPVRERAPQLRALVALAGVVQLLVAVPSLAGVLDLHVARDLGTFEVALAAGFLAIAWRPERASGLLPMAAVVAGLGFVSALSAVTIGGASLVTESTHLVDVVGTVALWALARGAAPLRPSAPVLA